MPLNADCAPLRRSKRLCLNDGASAVTQPSTTNTTETTTISGKETKLSYLPDELWCNIVALGDALSNYTSLRATNKFFKHLVEDDFKKRFCGPLMSETELVFRRRYYYGIMPSRFRSIRFALHKFSEDKTRAIFQRKGYVVSEESWTNHETEIESDADESGYLQGNVIVDGGVLRVLRPGQLLGSILKKELERIAKKFGSPRTPFPSASKTHIGKPTFTLRLPLEEFSSTGWAKDVFHEHEVPLYGCQVDVDLAETSLEWMPMIAAALHVIRESERELISHGEEE